jgi:fused signal recognition particle receptor
LPIGAGLGESGARRGAWVFTRRTGRSGEEAPEATGEPLAQGLAKTRRGFRDRLAAVFGPVDITDATWEELEDRLVQGDVGVPTATALVAELRERARNAGVRRADELPVLLAAVMVASLEAGASTAPLPAARPFVTLVVGVNGSGKTTTIAKLAHLEARAGRAVLLIAADTFRAAAIEQLQRWGERLGVPVIAGQPGGDPGAVVFDGLTSAAARNADLVLVDTAGRLHTQANLMAELAKVGRVVTRVDPSAPHETLLVMDATTGQNGLVQARAFGEAIGVTGLVLAKLDSSAKGGIALAVTRELGLPIRYVGTGEQLDDLTRFDATAYAAGLLGLAPTPAGRR